ncbi:MAG: ACP S-malonyltransferase [Eubacteriales bacterium]|jgi:[acyl-carrier-protein] S-malonyltransferase|nr:ACP S-malonyltransferase [Eubacteriales bacterium]MDD3290705.1 ACP S-malonyltransferase [Eubacteriales bacterium]MDD3863098.1 ACP S-malonyltransferase [Eubacteriales bacterium]
MAGIGFLFSGQGAQYTGMGKALYEYSPAARDVLDRLNEQRSDLLDLCFNGSAEDLSKTENTQPAVYAVDLAAAAAAKEAGMQPSAAAGFSLGELAALAFAGYYTPEEGFGLVQKRASFMADAAAKKPGAMLAVLRMENEAVEALCLGRTLYPVNYNCPGQLVVAGSPEDIQYLQEKIKEAKGRSIPLPVSGGFHSPFMDEAAAKMEAELKQVVFRDPLIPVYANDTGKIYGKNAAEHLTNQINHPVLWEDSIRNMICRGIDCFVEAGPGKALSGFVSRIAPEARVISVDSAEGLEKWKEEQGYVER